MGSKVLQGSTRGKLFRNAIWLPGVMRVQPEGNCLEMRRARACGGPSNVANATEHYAVAGALVYTTKISKSVCMYGCMYVCPAMRFVMLCGIKLKVGMGVGDGPTRFVGIFLKQAHLGSKVIQRSICLKRALWLPNLV